MTRRRALLGALLAVWGALIISCGLQDYDYEMCGGYCVVRSSAHEVVVAPKLGKSSWATRAPTAIAAKVVEVAWDHRFVIAKRQHLTRARSGRTNKPLTGNYDFWVIDTRDKVRYGPLSEVEFTVTRTELGVSAGLSLQKVTRYVTK
jgi:hypothetical protein